MAKGIPDRVTGAKAERDRLRQTLIGEGRPIAEIAERMAASFRLRPRPAWRHGHGWTQDETAARYNVLLGHAAAPMTGRRISDYEAWPTGGVKPTIVAGRHWGERVPGLSGHADPVPAD